MLGDIVDFHIDHDIVVGLVAKCGGGAPNPGLRTRVDFDRVLVFLCDFPVVAPLPQEIGSIARSAMRPPRRRWG